MPRPLTRLLTADLERQLRGLYAETDALFSLWSCPGRARCCEFGLTGRQPELWPIEWALLERSLRRRPGKRSEEAGSCPALDPSTRRCRAYGERPFGCRTHFCDEAQPGSKNPRAEVRVLARRLASLAEQATPGARLLPMLSWL